MKPETEATRSLHVRLPDSLYTVLKETSINHRLTMTEIIEDYLHYLKKQPKKERVLIDANTKIIPS